MIIDTDKLRAAIAEHFAGVRVTDKEVASEPAALLTQVRQDHDRADAIAATERVENLLLYYGEAEPPACSRCNGARTIPNPSDCGLAVMRVPCPNCSPEALEKLHAGYAARYGSGLKPL